MRLHQGRAHLTNGSLHDRQTFGVLRQVGRLGSTCISLLLPRDQPPIGNHHCAVLHERNRAVMCSLSKFDSRSFTSSHLLMHFQCRLMLHDA